MLKDDVRDDLEGTLLQYMQGMLLQNEVLGTCGAWRIQSDEFESVRLPCEAELDTMGTPCHREAHIVRGPMDKKSTLALLRDHKNVLTQRFAVVDIALFGSMARDEAVTDSDVDILVRFNGPADWRRYFGMQAYLEELLDRPVDLVTHKALRSELRPHVEREAIYV